jgi:hypothetical protein
MTHASSYTSRIALSLALCLIASIGWGRQTARLTITPDTALIDERFQIALDGLQPSQDVTIRVDGDRGVWRSSAEFRSDARGRVEVADPMRLVWSAAREGPQPGAPGPGRNPGQPWTFTCLEWRPR